MTPDRIDLLALARRHPRVRFFGGHIGGDWEWGVAALKQVDNVWLDVAGGDASGGYMEAALRGVGAGRIDLLLLLLPHRGSPPGAPL